MKLVKKKSDFDLNIFFREDDRILSFTFGGNGDLYWSIYLRDARDTNYGFTITKENYGVYSLFEKLFEDIDKVNDPRYRLYNLSQYNDLYDSTNKVITWYSDETAYVVANILRIKKEDEEFKINFYTQPYVDGYDRDFSSPGRISVRFRNSGSRYKPFNIVFMDMYNAMKEVDDVNDIGHQMHIEEYLYNKKLVKKLNR